MHHAQVPPVRTAAALGGALRRARRRQRLTQEQLADLAGVGVRFVSELERGKPSVELDRALHVLAVCGVDVFAVDRGADGG